MFISITSKQTNYKFPVNKSLQKFSFTYPHDSPLLASPSQCLSFFSSSPEGNIYFFICFTQWRWLLLLTYTVNFDHLTLVLILQIIFWVFPMTCVLGFYTRLCNRPGVAGAVLQMPWSLIDSVGHSFVQNLQDTFTPKS